MKKIAKRSDLHLLTGGKPPVSPPPAETKPIAAPARDDSGLERKIAALMAQQARMNEALARNDAALQRLYDSLAARQATMGQAVSDLAQRVRSAPAPQAAAPAAPAPTQAPVQEQDKELVATIERNGDGSMARVVITVKRGSQPVEEEEEDGNIGSA